MTDEPIPVPPPDLDEAPGWYVTDPDGNVVASGPIAVAQPAGVAAQLLTGEGE